MQASALPLGHFANMNEKGRSFNRPESCNGADNGARTRDPNLGKVVLYQLSHVRICKTKRAPERPDVAWRRSPDSNRG